jgi:hypothetical protein
MTSRGWRLRISRQASLQKFTQPTNFNGANHLLGIAEVATKKQRAAYIRNWERMVSIPSNSGDCETKAISDGIATKELLDFKLCLSELLRLIVLPVAAVLDAIVIFWVNETKAIPPLEYRPQISPNAPAL